jgi:hypothetical protein
MYPQGHKKSGCAYGHYCNYVCKKRTLGFVVLQQNMNNYRHKSLDNQEITNISEGSQQHKCGISAFFIRVISVFLAGFDVEFQ